MWKFMSSKAWSSVKFSDILLESQNLRFFNSKSNARLCAGAKVYFFITGQFLNTFLYDTWYSYMILKWQFLISTLFKTLTNYGWPVPRVTVYWKSFFRNFSKEVWLDFEAFVTTGGTMNNWVPNGCNNFESMPNQCWGLCQKENIEKFSRRFLKFFDVISIGENSALIQSALFDVISMGKKSTPFRYTFFVNLKSGNSTPFQCTFSMSLRWMENRHNVNVLNLCLWKIKYCDRFDISFW